MPAAGENTADPAEEGVGGDSRLLLPVDEGDEVEVSVRMRWNDLETGNGS